MTDHTAAHRRQRVIGALVGAVVGDALGAPFEFGASGEFSHRFPEPARGTKTEMCGGRGWKPAEWTDDTQMSLLIAASLLEHDGFEGADIFARFQAWLRADPADVGIQTEQVLSSELAWDQASARHFAAGMRAAGNGSIMRTVPAAIWFSRFGSAVSAEAARRISALTHGDPAAGDGCAIYHRMIGASLEGNDPLAVLRDALADVPADRRARWATVLADAWTPDDATEPNGAVWPTLGTAVWALRQGWSFEEAMRRVIDIGGDTDTIACVAGGLLGATYGIQSIPSRWTTPLNGVLPGNAPVANDLAELMELALRLDGYPASTDRLHLTGPIEPVEVEDGLWLSDLAGAAHSPEGAVVISLCRTFGTVTNPERRQVYLTDDDHNLDVMTVLNDVVSTIDALMREGKPVLVHCYGGASRTGLVYRAWLVRNRGETAAEATEESTMTWPPTGLWNDSFTEVLTRFAEVS